MEKINFIKVNWSKLNLLDMVQTLDIKLEEILEIALELNLYTKNTPNVTRRWEKAEDDFLIKYSNKLSVRDASNLFYRSHYATYQRIKYLGLNEMINKKKRKL